MNKEDRLPHVSISVDKEDDSIEAAAEHRRSVDSGVAASNSQESLAPVSTRSRRVALAQQQDSVDSGVAASSSQESLAPVDTRSWRVALALQLDPTTDPRCSVDSGVPGSQASSTPSPSSSLIESIPSIYRDAYKVLKLTAPVLAEVGLEAAAAPDAVIVQQMPAVDAAAAATAPDLEKTPAAMDVRREVYAEYLNGMVMMHAQLGVRIQYEQMSKKEKKAYNKRLVEEDEEKKKREQTVRFTKDSGSESSRVSIHGPTGNVYKDQTGEM